MAPFSTLACGQQMGLGHEWTFSPAELGSCTQEARLCSGDRLQVTGWLHAVQCISVPQMQPQSLPEGKKRSLMPWVPPSTGRRVRVASPLTEFKGGQAQRAPWAVDRLVSHNHDLAQASGAGAGRLGWFPVPEEPGFGTSSGRAPSSLPQPRGHGALLAGGRGSDTKPQGELADVRFPFKNGPVPAMKTHGGNLRAGY